MLTVTKSDLRHITDNLIGPAHYTFIFRELLEVYDDDIDYSLKDFLKPFGKMKFVGKITGTMERDNVKYSDYLCPLFYSAYVCKNENNYHIIKELVGMILKNYGHFAVNPDTNRIVNEMVGDIGDLSGYVQYWGVEKLNKEEQQRTYELYCDYLMAEQKGIEKCPIQISEP